MNSRKYPDILSDKIRGKESGYFNVSIMIEGLYKWGIGFESNEKFLAFHNEVYAALIDNGYVIEKNDISFECDYLHKEGSRLKLYMHPMKFSVPATAEQIKEITEILDSCSCINRIWIDSSDMLYDLSDMEYRDIFLDEAANLAEYMLQPYNIWDMDAKIAVDRIQSPKCGLLGNSDINYDVFNFIEEQIKELRANGVPDIEIPDVVQKRANDIKTEIHRLDDLFTEITTQLSLAGKKAFFKCEHIDDKEYDEYMSKYRLRTIGQYIEIAEWNEIHTSLCDAESAQVSDDLTEDNEQSQIGMEM